ncbi:MAG TPA: hypothetical protein VFI11_05830 [Anaerolineales bacterium]|nr:hypothetical protein [Anaerolineales bacterium]
MRSTAAEWDRGMLRRLRLHRVRFPTTVVALPIVSLLFAAFLTMTVGRRGRRAWKPAAIGFAALAWAAALALVTVIPETTSVSIWRPEVVFQDRLALILDVPGWTAGFTIAALTLAILVTETPAAEENSRRGAAYLLVYAALGVAASQASNLLTLAVFWSLLDLTGIAMLEGGKNPSESNGLRTRLLGSVAGTLIATAAVLGLPAAGRGTELTLVAAQPYSAYLFLAGVAVRIAASSIPVFLAEAENRRSAALALTVALPPAACLAALGRMGSSSSISPWVLVALGFLATMTGAVRWMLSGSMTGTPGVVDLTLGLVGLTTMAAVGTEGDSAAWSAGAALVLLGGVGTALAKGSRRTHRVGRAFTALVVAGLPLTAGGILVSFLARGTSPPEVTAAAAAFVGIAILAGGLWPRATEPTSDQARSPAGFTGVIPMAAWFLFAATGIATHAFLARRQDGASQLGSALGLGSLAIGAFALGRWSEASRHRAARALRWLDPRPAWQFLTAVAGLVPRAARGVADLVEGEAALLWIYVLVVALGVAASVGR